MYARNIGRKQLENTGYGETGVASILSKVKLLVTVDVLGHDGGVVRLSTSASPQSSLAGWAKSARLKSENTVRVKNTRIVTRLPNAWEKS